MDVFVLHDGGLHMGCPGYRFADLPARAGRLLGDAGTLRGWGLKDEQVGHLAELLPNILNAHARVSALALPDLSAHGDAHPRNALSGGLWFDWSEAQVAHPFLDAGWFFAFLAHPARGDLPLRKENPQIVEQLWAAYLTALDMSEAANLLPDAMRLALIHRAAVYHDRFERWTGTLPGWRPNYVPYYLKLLLYSK